MNQAGAPADRGPGRPLAGIGITVIAMVALAASDAISKYLTNLAPLMMIVWARYLVFVVYGVIAAGRQGTAGFRSARPGVQLIRGGALVLANIAIIYGFSKLPLGDTHAMLALAPLLVTVFAVFMLGEQVSADRWVAVLVGFIGIVLIVRPGTSVFNPVALYPLLGATFFATYQVLTRIVSGFDTQVTTQFYTGATGFVLFTLLVIPWWQWPPLWVSVLMVAGGALNMSCHLMIIQGLHWAPASLLQPFHYTMFAAAVVFGYLVFGDLPDFMTWVGAAIVIGSGLYAWYAAQRDQPK